MAEKANGAGVTGKKMINVRLNPALWARAKAAASERGLTLERWVTDALEAQIQRAPRGWDGAAASPTLAGDGDRVDELTWRVKALEEAVDYLAKAVGAGFPEGNGGPPGTQE